MVQHSPKADSECLLAELLEWVRLETQTGSIGSINSLLDQIVSKALPLGAGIERISGRAGMGDHLLLRFAGGSGPGILSVCHLDTVCQPGSVRMRREGDRFYGPGIADMKGGACLAFAAIRNIVQSGEKMPGPLTIIYNTDEEIGSPTSRDVIQSEAAKVACALIPEPARGDAFQRSVPIPQHEIEMRGAPWGQVLRQGLPLATCRKHIEDRVDNLAYVD